MRYTNKHNLPDTIVRAAYVNDGRYDKGKVHRSVTQLIQPPRIDMLRKAHFKEMEKDISEEWWALFGNAVHSILEMGASPNTVVEERLFFEIDGWWVSGMADLQEIHPKKGMRDFDAVSISDYKVTTAYVLTMDETVKPEWERQLNLLAYLVMMNKPVTIKDLSIIAIVRDWQRTQAQMDPMYPAAPVVRLKVPVWSLARMESYAKERVRLHREAEMLHAIDLPLPECSDEERWVRNTSWAVMKEGSKKASRVYDSEEEAEADVTERKKPGYKVVFRPGKPVRCDGNYCNVAEWCDQWQAIKEKQRENEDERAVEEDH